MPPPATSKQERAGWNDPRRQVGARIARRARIRRRMCPLWSPAVEPNSGGARIEKRERQPRPARVRVLSEIVQHIRERAPHLAWCLQRTRVKAIGKDAPRAPKSPVETARKPNRERLHATRETSLVGSLDDEVQMIRLHRIMRHCRATSVPLAQRLPHHAKIPLLAQARQPAHQPQSHVQWHVTRHALSRRVRHALRRTRSARTSASSAPGAEAKRRLLATGVARPSQSGRRSDPRPSFTLAQTVIVSNVGCDPAPSKSSAAPFIGARRRTVARSGSGCRWSCRRRRCRPSRRRCCRRNE